MTGTLRGGIVAVGGETTGWMLSADGTNAGGIDVDVSAVADQAKALDGKPVTVTGTVVVAHWVERGDQRMLVAGTIAAAAAPTRANG
jgi:hypothetical protein